MQKTRKIAVILTLAVTFLFVLVVPVQAEEAKQNLENLNRGANIAIWGITQAGTAKSIAQVDHAPNPRFTIYDPGTPEEAADDLVLDKETGLIWARNANLANGTKPWQRAIFYSRNISLGNRMGWRLPTVEELSSLVDPSQSDPKLPNGHPFINVQSDLYWTATAYESLSDYAWGVNMPNAYVQHYPKKNYYFVWPVRGGK
ncbi:MAG: DUF1566 domain-containing protein [Desulfobacterales bacterium]|jgi:hypothetical protein